MNRRVLCEDSLECFAPLLVAKAISWVSAQNIYTVCFSYLVPESFEPNRRVRLPLPPQERRAFSASGNMGMLSSCRFPRCHKESTRDLPKSHRIRKIIDHECGQCVGSIQRNISPLSLIHISEPTRRTPI